MRKKYKNFKARKKLIRNKNHIEKKMTTMRDTRMNMKIIYMNSGYAYSDERMNLYK
jgi:hypothetical protein